MMSHVSVGASEETLCMAVVPSRNLVERSLHWSWMLRETKKNLTSSWCLSDICNAEYPFFAGPWSSSSRKHASRSLWFSKAFKTSLRFLEAATWTMVSDSQFSSLRKFSIVVFSMFSDNSSFTAGPTVSKQDRKARWRAVSLLLSCMLRIARGFLSITIVAAHLKIFRKTLFSSKVSHCAARWIADCPVLFLMRC